MNKNLTFRKSLGILPFVIYLLINSIWTLSYETRIITLIAVIEMGLIAIYLQNNKSLYFLLGGSIILVLSIFSYQYAIS